ncbi:MAG: GNAT family N-acetyltransferase, partial [Planctomycetes bacterium]|nr:GNAT family N-acetyltransferase [Planctomycetota bacterium]
MPRDLTDVVISLYRDGDDEEILRVFNRVFGDGRTLDEWRWLYHGNPEGLQTHLARFENGEVVSEFCAIPRRVKLPDGPALFGEVVDSYTDPSYRKGLKRRGPFASAGEWFAQTFGRYDRDVIMYGLPTPANFRIGQRFLGYTHVEEVDMLFRKLGPGEVEPVGSECHVTRVDRFSEDVNDLYRRVEPAHECIVVRDTRYLNWRYADRPDVAYELLEARECNGVLVAAIVLRHGWCDNPVTAVCDAVLRPHPGFPGIVRYLEARG